MKQLLRGLLGFTTVIGLALAVMWLVRAAPGRQSIAQATSQQTAEAKATATLSTETVTTTSSENHPPKPTPQLNFDKLKIEKVEEIPTGPYLNILWSPDGTRALTPKKPGNLYFLTGGGQSGIITGLGDLWLLDLPTGAEYQLANQMSSVVWSPDSKQIAYLAPTGEKGIAGALYVLNIASNQTRQIAQVDFLGGDYNPQWLPTDEITFARDGQLWTVRSDGSGERVLNGFKLQSRVGAENGKPIYMADPKAPIGYHFSPTGERVAYLTRPDNERDFSHLLWLANMDGSNTQLVTNTAESSYYNWSPNGEWLVFNTFGSVDDPFFEKRELWVVKKDGINPLLLHQGDNWERILSPTWAPNNQMIVFIVEHAPKEGQPDVRDLWLAEVTTGRTRKLNEAIGNIVSLSWSPDGKYLYILEDTTSTSSAFQSSRLQLATQ